jgi:hypothetical protein
VRSQDAALSRNADSKVGGLLAGSYKKTVVLEDLVYFLTASFVTFCHEFIIKNLKSKAVAHGARAPQLLRIYILSIDFRFCKDLRIDLDVV